jgi:hypothetical protein
MIKNNKDFKNKDKRLYKDKDNKLSLNDYYDIIYKLNHDDYKDDIYKDYDFEDYLYIKDILFNDYDIDINHYLNYQIINKINHHKKSIYQYLSNVIGYRLFDFYLLIFLNKSDIKRLINQYFNHDDYFNKKSDKSIKLIKDYQDLIYNLIIDYIDLIKNNDIFDLLIDYRLNHLDKLSDDINRLNQKIYKKSYIKNQIDNISDFYLNDIDNLKNDLIDDKDIDKLDDIINIIDDFKSLMMIN